MTRPDGTPYRTPSGLAHARRLAALDLAPTPATPAPWSAPRALEAPTWPDPRPVPDPYRPSIAARALLALAPRTWRAG